MPVPSNFVSQYTLAQGRQVAVRFTYANATARNADTRTDGPNSMAAEALSSNDVGAIAHQLDNDTFWILTDHTGPTWLQISGGGPGSDTDAIHDNVAAEISAITEKTTPVAGDWLIIEDSAASDAKKKLQVGNLPGDDDAIHDNVSGEIAAITEKTTPVNADLIVIEDSAASNAKKRVQLGNIPVTDDDAIHDNVSGEISSVTEKLSPVSADLLLIEDSAAANAKKRVQIGNLPVTDDDAIHDNVSGEINAVTEKVTPVSGDWLLIEDSAASNAKKKIQVGNLPSSGGGVLPTLEFGAVQLRTPLTADWAVNDFAPAASSSNNSALLERRFDDSTEEGVGLLLEIPSTATSMKLKFRSRAETAPGATQTVKLNFYEREVPDNAAVGAWSSAIQLGDISIPTNENYQYDETDNTLATWGLTAGSTHQIQITRDTGDAGDTLVGDWNLLTLIVEYS